MSTGFHSGYTDAWCDRNCNWTPSFCPAQYCTQDCLGGSGRRRLAESAPAPWSSSARAAAVAAPLALAAVAGLAVYGRRHRASQASNLADIESCAEEA